MHCDLNFPSQQTIQHLEGANAHTKAYVHCTRIKASHVGFRQYLSMMARHHNINVAMAMGLCSYQRMSIVKDYCPTEP